MDAARMNAFIDDLSPVQMWELLVWLAKDERAVTPANLKYWRSQQGLPVSLED